MAESGTAAASVGVWNLDSMDSGGEAGGCDFGLTGGRRGGNRTSMLGSWTRLDSARFELELVCWPSCERTQTPR